MSNMKAEILVEVCLNGKVVWVKSRHTKVKNTFRMTEIEYGRVLDAAEEKLTDQVDKAMFGLKK